MLCKNNIHSQPQPHLEKKVARNRRLRCYSRRFITHHIQRISFGIAMEDAKQINRRITCLKQRAYRTSRRS
jgi:hypothetical protein